MDLELYAFIAIIIREFVLTWYGKITNDQGFVEEVVRIIAHCTRGLEQRLRKVDLEGLLFDELPELLEAHVKGMILWERYMKGMVLMNVSISSFTYPSTSAAV